MLFTSFILKKSSVFI